MFRKFAIVGLVSAVSFAVLCGTSEAGHHHRRARNTGCQSSVPMQQSGCNSGCANYSGIGYGTQPWQTYGSNYGNAGMAGDYGAYGSQGYVNGNVRGTMLGSGMVRGR